MPEPTDPVARAARAARDALALALETGDPSTIRAAMDASGFRVISGDAAWDAWDRWLDELPEEPSERAKAVAARLEDGDAFAGVGPGRRLDAWDLRARERLPTRAVAALRRAIVASAEERERPAARPREVRRPDDSVPGPDADLALPSAVGAPDPATERELLSSDDGAPRECATNLGTILVRDPRWAGKLRWNELARREEWMRAGKWVPLTDSDVVTIRRWVACVYGIELSPTAGHEQVSIAARRSSVHPVRERLEILAPWDGVPRAERWLAELCGVSDSPLVREYAKRWLIGCVARVYEPGCKLDVALILVGVQGARKSSLLRALVFEPEWYADSEIPLGHSQDRYQVLDGRWIVEWSEIDRPLRTRDASELKAYLSSQVDSFRASYGRRTETRPRQCVIVGTTNHREILTDDTGDRRYWVVECGTLSPERAAVVRDQLWAEALALYRAGERWHLDAPADAERAAANAAHRDEDPWIEWISRWLDGGSPTLARRDEVALVDLLVGIGLDASRVRAPEGRRAASCLRRLGWRLQKTGGRSVWRRE